MRIGLYGGTFAPVHNGHINAAISFIKAAKLDKLIVMPAFIPPHKSISKSDDPLQRFFMLKLAFDNVKCENCSIDISDYEISAKGASYTVNTLEHLSSENDELIFLCGSDMFITLEEWYRASRIFELTSIAYIKREQPSFEIDSKLFVCANKYRERYDAKILEVRTDVVELSSTQLRESYSRGISQEELVPKKVDEYILENKLYTDSTV